MSRPAASSRQTSVLHRPAKSLTACPTHPPQATTASRIAQRPTALRPPSALISTTRTTSISPTNSTSTVSQGTSAPPSHASASVPHALYPPNPALFLTNLRLLDLQLLPDWPHITPRSLSAKDGQPQNQKERIRIVEWALYHLFVLWEPDEARFKLQPFFPPLEPLQSLNLRAALFRCLSELKKNGILGRETVLRKTMLDDCKGDKFWEVLLAFSSAVLRKIKNADIQRKRGVRALSSRHFAAQVEHIAERHATIGLRLALAATPTRDQQASMLPLAIAHRAHLNQLLERKKQQKARFATFADLIVSKEVELATRRQASVDSSLAMPAVGGPGKVLERIRSNWTGTSAWPEALLQGDAEANDDEPFQRSFREVWHVVMEGGIMQQRADRDVGLIAQLESRIQTQRARLQSWRAWKQRMLDLVASSRKGSGDRIVEGGTPHSSFIFDQHARPYALKSELTSNSSRIFRKSGDRDSSRYSIMIAEMKAELSSSTTSNTRSADSGFLDLSVERRAASRDSSQTKSTEALRKNFESLASSKLNPAIPPSRFLPRRMFSPSALFSPLRNVPAARGENGGDSYASFSDTLDADKLSAEGTGKVLNDVSDTVAPARKINSQCSVRPGEDAPDSTRPTHWSDVETKTGHNGHKAADQGISSPQDLQPSTPSGPLTLIERTRLSMLPTELQARPPTKRHDSAESIHNGASNSVVRDAPTAITQNAEQHRETLLERTRQSMAFMTQQLPSEVEASRGNMSCRGPRLSVNGNELIGTNHRRLPRDTATLQLKKQRQSITYPVNQFETPRKGTHLSAFEEADESACATEANGDELDGRNVALGEKIRRIATPTEKLYAADADVASVFRSRPKIRASPVLSPVIVHGDDDSAPISYFDDSFENNDRDLDRGGNISPLGYR